MRKWFNVGIIVCFMTLTGCTGLNSRFDCPNQAGVRCKSLDQINGMVDSGQIRGRGAISRVDVVDVTDEPAFQAYHPNAMSAAAPMRSGETIQRIWIAPYEDTEGNYHLESYVYAVMKVSHWDNNSIKTAAPF
jgi:conjugal transfer pilus assembly protein TraV